MNLISRITLVYAIFSLIVFIIGGFITYRVMEREIDFEQRNFLAERLQRAEDYIESRMPQDTVTRYKLVIFPVSPEVEVYEPFFSDTLVVHTTLDRLEKHLKLRVVRELNGKKYQFEIYDIIVESDDIVDGVVESLIITYLILLGVLLILGFVGSYAILRPYRNILDYVKHFSLRDAKKENLIPNTGLPDLQGMIDFLNEMILKAIQDYQSLKEFSENASHELKTPLAIIQGKIDLLLEDSSLTENQIEKLTSIQSTIIRLNRLSNSLSILTKIDNREFSNRNKCDISDILNNMILDFKELVDLKSISLESSIEDNVEIFADKTLMELLISNLISNAIKHNFEKGEIVISLDSKRLVIYNTGEELQEDPQVFFQRFKKKNNSHQSLGLGLAIVQKICDFSGFSINYRFNQKHHTLSISLCPDNE